MRARRSMLATLVVMIAALAGAAIVAVPALARAPRQIRVGSVPRHPAGSSAIGSLSGTTRLSALVALKPSDPSGLAAYAQAVSTPGSSVYRQFLSVAEFRQRFGPTQAQIDDVESALRAAGLEPGAVSPNGLLIHIAARASALAHAFDTSFQRVRLKSGRTAFANTSAPQFPAAVSGYVRGVIGLDSLNVPQPLGLAVRRHGAIRAAAARPHALAHVVTGGPQPCTLAGQGNTADKIASAYDFAPLYQAGDQGAGQTIALIELEPDSSSDIAQYQTCYGTNTPVIYFPVDGGTSGTQIGEAALDIEQVIGLAPQATIDVYQTQDIVQNLIDDYTAAVDNPNVNVIETSWGNCEPQAPSALVQAETTLFAQAATEGKSVFASTGDNGSTDCNTSALAVDDPGSQQFVTAVGGTKLSNYQNPAAQTVWNDSDGASGGGISTLTAMPSYQSGAPAPLGVIGSASSNTPCHAPVGSYCRQVPDVSANAAVATGYPIVFKGAWTTFGGTSAAAPVWAAYTALVNGSSTCGGAPVGFTNPLLYGAAASNYATEFDDITSGNNNWPADNNHSGLYVAGTGYDMATGLGTPIGEQLATTLCDEADTVTVSNPGTQQTYYDVPTSLQIVASDSENHPLSYSSPNGLPQGLSISQFTGQITGTPTATGTSIVNVKVSDPVTGAYTTISFTWAIPINPSCSPTNPNLLVNPGFESGVAGWSATPNVIVADTGTEAARSGTHFAWLDGYTTPHTDTLSQTVTLPLGCTYMLSYYQSIDTTDGSNPVDTLTTEVLASNGTVLKTLTPPSNIDWTGPTASAPATPSSYQLVTVDLTSAVAGQQTITLKFIGAETNAGGGTTDFLLDDLALTVAPPP